MALDAERKKVYMVQLIEFLATEKRLHCVGRLTLSQVAFFVFFNSHSPAKVTLSVSSVLFFPFSFVRSSPITNTNHLLSPPLFNLAASA